MHFQKFRALWSRKNSKERVFIILGGLSLALAVIGLFLPLVPQVPFAILAAFFFSRGSHEIHHWLRHHRHLGPYIRDWEDNGILRPKLKLMSSLALIAGAVFAHLQLPPQWALMVDGVFLLSLIFILTRPSDRVAQH